MREPLEDAIFGTRNRRGTAGHSRPRAATHPGQGAAGQDAAVGTSGAPLGSANGPSGEATDAFTDRQRTGVAREATPGRDGGGDVGGVSGGHGGGGPQGRDADDTGASAARRGGSGGLIRRWVSLAAAAVLVAGGGYLAWDVASPLYHSLTAPKDYTGPGTGSVSFVVKSGETGATIGSNLAKAGIIQTAGAFSSAMSDNPGAQIQPGTYLLKKQMKASDALAALRNPAARNVKKATIIEGMWKTQVFAALSKATGQPLAAYTAAAAKPEGLGLPAAAKGNVEGYLFPATYEFQPGDTAATQLKTLIAKANEQLQALGVPQAQQQRIVTMASIIEAEAGAQTDRPKVARVLLNRLARGMKLQLDSTVSYGVQRRAITTTDQERADRNGWNTYYRAGLPVGPIGNPGTASLKAAMNPGNGPWLFFVTVNPETGLTKFATTAAEHAQYVSEFQAWCQGHPGVC